jgi:hypothetical protein
MDVKVLSDWLNNYKLIIKIITKLIDCAIEWVTMNWIVS